MVSFSISVNQFTALTTEEKQNYLGLRKTVTRLNQPLFNIKGPKPKAATTTKKPKTTTTKKPKTTTTKKPKTTTTKKPKTTTSTTTTIETTDYIDYTDFTDVTNINPSNTTTLQPSTATLDWRNTPGMIQPVRNQGQCG